MKKVFYFGLFIATLFVVAACSSNSPGAAAKKYAEYMKDGKYEQFIAGIAQDESVTAEQRQQQKDMLVAMLKEKGEKTINQRGGIKNIEVVSEEISEDGNTATVVLKQTYGDGETDDSTFEMVKLDGEWKMMIKK